MCACMITCLFRAEPICQQPKPSIMFNFLAKTLGQDLAQSCPKSGKILGSWARLFLHGQDLDILPKCLGQELFAGYKGRSARGKPFCISYLEVSHCVSASQR